MRGIEEEVIIQFLGRLWLLLHLDLSFSRNDMLELFFYSVDRCCFLCCKSVLCSDSEPPITTFATQFDNHHQLSRGFVFIAGQLLWWWITWVGIYLSICGSCPRYLVRDREHHNWGTSPSILWQKIGSRGGGIFIIGLDFLIRIVSLVQHRLLRLDCGPWKGDTT